MARVTVTLVLEIPENPAMTLPPVLKLDPPDASVIFRLLQRLYGRPQEADETPHPEDAGAMHRG